MKKNLVIAIDGPAASGKSTLAQYLKRELDASVFHMDDYFLPLKMKTTERLMTPGGNVHYERMQDEILSHLKSDLIQYQRYNCMTLQLEQPINESIKKYVVIEGVYSQQKKLREYYDFCIYTDISKNEQFKRLEIRNPKLLDKFINEWLPQEDNYFSKEDIRNNSDYQLLLKNNDK